MGTKQERKCKSQDQPSARRSAKKKKATVALSPGSIQNRKKTKKKEKKGPYIQEGGRDKTRARTQYLMERMNTVARERLKGGGGGIEWRG